MSNIMKVMLSIILTLFGVFLVVWIKSGRSQSVGRRLTRVKEEFNLGEKEESKPFSERLVKPFYMSVSNFFSRFTPSNILDEYDELLVEAGYGKDYTSSRLVTNQVLFTIIVTIVSLYIMRNIFGSVNLSVFAVLVVGSIYLPVFYLRRKSEERKDRIQKSLPNVLDMVYISVEAGLSFDAAMTITASKTEGELSDEILRAMGEINRGRSREDALYSIAERTRVDDVRSFMSTIILSEKLGSNIANVLRIQAEVIRDRRRQRAEETINKMPIKMLLPLVFLLLPAVMTVIMGPAIVNVMNSSFL